MLTTGITVEPVYRRSCSFAGMASIGERIKQRREELRLSQSAVGKAAGGLAYQTIQDLESGASKGSKHLVAIARALGVKPQWLEKGDGEMLESPTPVIGKDAVTSPEINLQAMPRDVPILGAASCGDDGMFELNGQTVDYAKRLPQIMGAKDVYVLYVQGESMAPWRKNGGKVYVDPHKPVSVGDHIVVQLMPEGPDATPAAYIKCLVRRTAEYLFLQQYNPNEERKFSMKKVKAIHRIMEWDELV